MLKLEGHLHKHKRALEDALHDVGRQVIVRTRQLIIDPPKTGRIYPFEGGQHQASAPGEAPAYMTGRLARSGEKKVRGWQEMEVGETAFYAVWLENGRRGMAPRPHLIRAVEETVQDVARSILNNVAKEING